ncbi:MAG: hypothetical protein ACKOB0_11880, partial [Chthoniobacterales bacterium]
VTGEGDKPASPELYAQKAPHVAHWFGTNMFAEAADTTPIPLGLGNEEDATTLIVEEIAAGAARGIKREKLLYANFGAASNPAVREPLRDWLQKSAQQWITRESHGGLSGKAAYVDALYSHHFVFCPPGNGEDTHRMWEALYCGAIPVVRESPAMRNFRDLPILFVTRLDSLSEQFLLGQLATWSQQRFSREKLGMEYWKAQFSAAQQMVRSQGPVGLVEWAKAWIDEAVRIVRRRP